MLQFIDCTQWGGCIHMPYEIYYAALQINFQQPEDDIQQQTPAQEGLDCNVKSKSAGQVQEEIFIGK